MLYFSRVDYLFEGIFVEQERSHLISVIIPAYNAEKTIEEAVDSVLSQSYENIEVILIDDHSSDGTKELLEALADKDPRVRVLSNDTNIGVLKTRLKGVHSSFGKWIAFLDSDDVWESDKLEKQVRLQEETASYLVYSGTGYIGKNGAPLSWVFHVPSEVTYKKLLKQNVISNSSVLVLKDVFLHFTPVSEDGNDMHEDFACWLSILKNGHKISGIDEPLVKYRVSNDSLTGNKFHAAVLNWRTYRFIGLNVFQAAFYMAFYAVNGMIKYKHIRKKA